jgi:hypothetical protein
VPEPRIAASRGSRCSRPAVNDRLAQRIEATVLAGDPIAAAAALEDQITPEPRRAAAGAVGPA